MTSGKPPAGFCKNGHDKRLPGGITTLTSGRKFCTLCYKSGYLRKNIKRAEKERCVDPSHEHMLRVDGKPYCRTCARKRAFALNRKHEVPVHDHTMEILRLSERLETAMPWEKPTLIGRIEFLRRARA